MIFNGKLTCLLIQAMKMTLPEFGDGFMQTSLNRNTLYLCKECAWSRTFGHHL